MNCQLVRQGRGAGTVQGAGRGQALVEFALVVPIIVLILIAVFDLGRAVYAYNTISNAARQGARVASVNQIRTSPDCNEDRPVESVSSPHWSITRCAADAAVSLGVSPSAVTIAYAAPAGTTLVCTDTNVQVGCLVSVTVAYAYHPITPVIDAMVGTLQMNSTAQVVVERVFP